AAFRAFGFVPTVRLGEAWLRRWPDAAQAAEVHSMLALSAYCLTYAGGFGPSEDGAGRVIGTALQGGPPAEAHAAHHAHPLSRRAVVAARGRRDAAQSLAFAERSIAAAQAIDDGRAPYYEAWARNAKGLALFRAKRLADATAECERAHALLRTA